MKTQPTPALIGQLFAARLRRVALGIVLLASLGAEARAEAAVGAQLLPNGDLETATVDPHWPDNWSRPTAGSCSWEAEEGRHFLRLNVVQPGDVVLTYRSIVLTPAVKDVQVKLRARVIGLKCGPQPWFDARVMADFKTKDGQKMKGAKTIAFRKDTGGWIERTVRFSVPDGAATLELMPTLFKAYSGTFDIDELIVTSVEPAAAPAAAPEPTAILPAGA